MATKCINDLLRLFRSTPECTEVMFSTAESAIALGNVPILDEDDLMVKVTTLLAHIFDGVAIPNVEELLKVPPSIRGLVWVFIGAVRLEDREYEEHVGAYLLGMAEDHGHPTSDSQYDEALERLVARGKCFTHPDAFLELKQAC